MRGEGSLAAFLERERPRLDAVFARYRIPPPDTEDLLQQALLRFVRQAGGASDPSAWLAGALRHQCLLYWRDRPRGMIEGAAVDDAALE